MNVADLMALLDGLPADTPVLISEWNDHAERNEDYLVAEVAITWKPDGHRCVIVTSEGSAG